MGKFDAIDILFISLISLYLIVLLILIMWINITKIESFLKSKNVMSNYNKNNSKQVKKIKPQKNRKLEIRNKISSCKNNNSIRNKGYINPNKRKKIAKKTISLNGI